MTDVLCSGTFQILHRGHCELLEFASMYGKVTVGLNGDNYVKKKYGDLAVPYEDREHVLLANRYVHNVVRFDEDDPSGLILRLRPRIYIRGPDYRDIEVPELDTIRKVGCIYLVHDAEKKYSSTKLMDLGITNIILP